jgi:hypothetical protein
MVSKHPDDGGIEVSAGETGWLPPSLGKIRELKLG